MHAVGSHNMCCVLSITVNFMTSLRFKTERHVLRIKTPDFSYYFREYKGYSAVGLKSV